MPESRAGFTLSHVRKGVPIALALAVVALAGCAQLLDAQPQQEARNELRINEWLGAIENGDASEVCAGVTRELRAQAIERVGSCDELARRLSGRLPSNVSVTSSEKVGGSDKLDKGTYRYETDSNWLFLVSRDKIGGVMPPNSQGQ